MVHGCMGHEREMRRRGAPVPASANDQQSHLLRVEWGGGEPIVLWWEVVSHATTILPPRGRPTWRRASDTAVPVLPVVVTGTSCG